MVRCRNPALQRPAGNNTALSAYTESNGITSNTIAYTNTTATKFFSSVAFTGNHVEKTRAAFETALAYGPVKFQGEYIHTNFDGHTLAAASKSIDKDIDAWYTTLTWMVTGESYADSYKDGMFGRMTPKRNLALGKEGFGAIELGVRYSKFDASDFKTAAAGCVAGTGCLATATTTAAFTNEADAWTAGGEMDNHSQCALGAELCPYQLRHTCPDHSQQQSQE